MGPDWQGRLLPSKWAGASLRPCTTQPWKSHSITSTMLLFIEEYWVCGEVWGEDQSFSLWKSCHSTKVNGFDSLDHQGQGRLQFSKKWKTGLTQRIRTFKNVQQWLSDLRKIISSLKDLTQSTKSKGNKQSFDRCKVSRSEYDLIEILLLIKLHIDIVYTLGCGISYTFKKSSYIDASEWQ
jgi:hypothetical protein